MNLTFPEAAKGINKDITLNVMDVCPKCRGGRAEPGTKATSCTACNGTGMETMSTGPFVMRSTCRSCHGTRVYLKYKCTECEGKGNTIQRKKITVPVPAGVEHGQTVRMAIGKKEVFITFKVENSSYFRREGNDVHTTAAISLSQAVLGGTIRIQGLYEDHHLQVSPGTSSGSKIRLSGKGIKRLDGYGFGDHYVSIKIVIPKSLTNKQRALLQAYAELEEDTPGQIFGITSKHDGTKINISTSEHLDLIRAALAKEKKSKNTAASNKPSDKDQSKCTDDKNNTSSKKENSNPIQEIEEAVESIKVAKNMEESDDSHKDKNGQVHNM